MIRIKDFQETFPMQFDFSSTLGAETIVAQSVAVTDNTGVDTTPTNLFKTLSTLSGAVVTQWVTAGVLGSIYHLRCSITTSGGRVLVLAQDIQVVKR